MSLRKSNPHLKAAKGITALRLSAETSSAVEGIRAPFKKSKSEQPESDVKEGIRKYIRKRHIPD